LNDYEKCRFHPEAINSLRKCFENTFGTGDPDKLEFNALKLVNVSTSESERVSMWVEKASQDLRDIFKDVESYSIQEEDKERKSKRVMTIETSVAEPFQCWMFMSTARMTRYTEATELTDTFNRVSQLRSLGNSKGQQGFTNRSP